MGLTADGHLVCPMTVKMGVGLFEGQQVHEFHLNANVIQPVLRSVRYRLEKVKSGC